MITLFFQILYIDKNDKQNKLSGDKVLFCILQNTGVDVQKQPSRGILEKSSSENMQKIYRRTPMSKCDCNNVVKQFYWNHTSTSFCCKFAAYFKDTFSKNTNGGLFLDVHRCSTKQLFKKFRKTFRKTYVADFYFKNN